MRSPSSVSPCPAFEFAAPERVVFGIGVAGRVGGLAASFGRSVLLVTGRDPHRADPVRHALQQAGVTWSDFCVVGEPTVTDAETGARQAREARVDAVVACGGGAVLDAGKAIAALATHPGDPFRFLEIVGQGLPLERDPLPVLALPTTAGTGSEATRNAVLASPAHALKVSLRSPRMVPRAAVIDPALAVGLPADLTACTGLDALTQLLEPWVGCRANGMTDACAREGIPRVARSLGRAIAHGDDLGARTDLAFGAYLSGLALAHAGLGAVHGLAGPIGGRFGRAPHGAVCAALLAPVCRVNLEALRRIGPDHPAIARYRQAFGWLTGHPDAPPEDGLRWIRESVTAWKVPRLSRHGISPADFPALVAAAQASSSMKGNPVRLPDEALVEALAEAL